jgi:ubiquinone/menaquinone biosynthesis C-methylase UbiE
MASPSDFSSGITSAGTEQFRRMGLSHLFQFDLSALKQTGQAFPERQDVSGIQHVLDVACGSGEWTIAVARANPDMQVVGIDNNAQFIEEAQTKAQGVTNVSFLHADPLDPRDLADSSFDLVNARFLVGLLPLEIWPNLIQTCLRLTRRGGIVRLTEGDIPITNSPAFERMNELLSRALWPTYHIFPTGENLVITPLLRRLLQQAGCQDIQKAA